MASFSFRPQGVCSQEILFDVDAQGRVHNVQFIGGCPGNLTAIGKLVEGADARQIATLLKGNDCAGKGTSCADQLARALEEAIKK
ncbi:TIGR03905 family TSCPD domain-containing protein [Candidatus Avelusimicrobium luingense]|uniref:TIGR03905 family TSCPD domain-containing protein n=1 Tax=Candidatus Avelusimicrobium luingense TaxID=3416211 RepID=UPI003D14ABC2